MTAQPETAKSRPARRRLFRRPRLGLPNSIASRIAMTLVLALLLTQAISALVYLTDRSEGPPIHGPNVLVQRVTAIVQLVESTPPPGRERVVRAIDDPVLRVEWHPDRPPPLGPDAFPSGRFEALRHRLRESLDTADRNILVEVRLPSESELRDRPPPRPPFVADDIRRWGPHVRLSVRLGDGSWLSFTGGDPLPGPFRIVRFLLWMGGVAAVILVVSLLAARRAAAPLAGFAAAAERLSIDGHADPLTEEGPRELRAATRAFNRMQARLARFVTDRTQMLAAIGHDLRTPITRLRLRAELVDDPEMQRRMLADLDEMEAMISATLAFARDDAQREPRGRFDLADLLQSLCDDRVDSGHRALYDGPAHVVAEGRPVALRRALANLMDNAIKYGGGFTVRLETGADGASQHRNALIHIDDDGPGIPEAEFEKVFAPFYRLERSRSRDTGGVGLGLSTARSIIRGHGGDVTLANRGGGGLRATVTLPL
ncbi:signal transduction histidine kinase [Azospirillum lipoferum]|uniref:histidine kinase n=1 Tax=Azospirillum lipoferum TaxID=193 RepID=A0A5A9G0Z8_AZOLI|nr:MULTISPECIES: ATP-binding protein [Azospirillum]KAA0587986.1 HAMP domain-containing protein [Azospirillum lipoferum]MCP1612170.1 signal transduction histidine kinase [Azospirillum lipoferum]MDW5536608.1 ATP-binding protein [Azospirillum sp. NL1]